MQVIIDQAGRIIVPKPVRDRLGLRKDSALDLQETAEGIVLKPVNREPRLMRDENGWLVFSGTSEREINWDTVVDDMREQRIREIGGW